jgi:ABC-2 type transport system ATP-binding protein
MNGAAAALLRAEGLTKVFRRRAFGGAGAELRAVDGVSFTVTRGDIYGFLGPNGAGKSTTIRLALGLVHPSAGRVAIAGHDLATDRRSALSRVGAFVEAPSFYPYLSGRRNLEVFAALSGGVSRSEIEAALARVGILDRADDKVVVYSHGMKARLGLAGCLLPRPELLILDEPTDGLDPHGTREVHALIRQLARHENLTVFLSTHRLGEVEGLCNRVAILDRGRLVLEGALAELEQKHRRHRVVTDRPAQAAELLRRRFGLEARPPAADDSALEFTLDDLAPERVNAALVGEGLSVRAMMPEPAWLDRLFLELTVGCESSGAGGAKEGEP